MPTLNRFPILGLWAAEAARRAGYDGDEAASLGHAYAVLYAIRAQGPYKPKGYASKAIPIARPGMPELDQDRMNFGGDSLDVAYVDGRLRGRVGGGSLQTPQSFGSAVLGKVPTEYREKLLPVFQGFWAGIKETEANSPLVYSLYDEFKKSCAKGRLIDLDLLLEWIRERTKDALPDAANSPANLTQDA